MWRPACNVLSALIVICMSCSGKKEGDVGNSPAKPRPNIVIILADDLGYGDSGIYNDSSKIATPNIDALAKSGIRFTDAHTPSSVCTPTRYGLLTGRYAWRTPLKQGVLWPWDGPLIEPQRMTLPKMLKENGYATACIGKWHLGWEWPAKSASGYVNARLVPGDHGSEERELLYQQIDFSKSLGGGPVTVGFDSYFGDDVPNFPPYAYIENDRLVRVPDTLKPKDMFGAPGPMVKGWRLEEVMPTITRKAVSYITERKDSETPFLLYFALTAPHTPIAPEDDFKGKSRAGAYGDFVTEVDWAVGQVVEALRSTGKLDNTVVIFTSDNGSPQRDGTAMAGPVGSVKRFGHDPSRPWRGLKGDIWEGGHRVPFIVSWPGKVPEDRTIHATLCLTDVMPTIGGLLGLPEAVSRSEDGLDQSALMLGSQTKGRSTIVHHAFDGTFAIRKGPWKLILGKDSGGFSKNLKITGMPVDTDGQLYNLTEDPGEIHNRYGEFPDKVAELSGLLQDFINNGTSNPRL